MGVGVEAIGKAEGKRSKRVRLSGKRAVGEQGSPPRPDPRQTLNGASAATVWSCVVLQPGGRGVLTRFRSDWLASAILRSRGGMAHRRRVVSPGEGVGDVGEQVSTPKEEREAGLAGVGLDLRRALSSSVPPQQESQSHSKQKRAAPLAEASGYKCIGEAKRAALIDEGCGQRDAPLISPPKRREADDRVVQKSHHSR